jgi:MazG family protein
MRQLLQLMRRLRDPHTGCPWDLQQDHRSLARYLLEEAHECVAAIESGVDGALRDELGDVLFQIVFHAQLASERGSFDLDQVAAAVAAKLEHRHPHVFGAADREAGSAAWEQIKREERVARGAGGVLDDVPLALPALLRAVKLGKRAAAVGFDWPDAAGPRAKILEELDEVEVARQGSGSSTMEEEIGDLLLAVTSLARHLHVDPESALRGANLRFETRFRDMEHRARLQGQPLDTLTAAQLDVLWEQAKRAIQS